MLPLILHTVYIHSIFGVAYVMCFSFTALLDEIWSG